MTRMAQGLQIVRIDKQRPITTVGNNVINVRSSDAQALQCAVAAKGFSQELIRPKVVTEYRQLVPSVPVCRFLAAPHDVPWSVFRTVALTGQDMAANMSARPQGLLCHGLSPPGKQKAPEPSHRLGGSAQARWLRLSGSIFTMDSCLQFLHQTGILLPTVSGRIRSTFCRLQMGHRRYPSFVLILS